MLNRLPLTITAFALHKRSGIANDPNRTDDPDYIARLFA
jgi:hypothetical protein